MIDLYCERLGPGLWSEPINALTNIAFLVAAWASWRLARRSGNHDGSISGLIALMASVGIGSALFHTFATTWAQILDVVPILIFQLFFLWIYLRRVISTGLSYSTLAVVGLLIAALLGRAVPHGIELSLQYAPALVVLIGFGVYHYRTRKQAPLVLLGAAVVFALSLLFRTIDQSTCPYIPFGTHFLWHVLNALVLYLLFRGLLPNLRST